MVQQIKKLILVGALGYLVYLALAYHVIFFGRDFETARKNELTFKHTFYSIASEKELRYKGLDFILKNEDLRDAGIAEMIVDRGWATWEEVRKVERELY